MSITDKKGINITSGFKLVSGQPLDARSVAEDETDLQSLIDNGAVYDGMIVWVKSLSKYMSYNGTEFVEMSTGGGVSSNVINLSGDAVDSSIQTILMGALTGGVTEDSRDASEEEIVFFSKFDELYEKIIAGTGSIPYIVLGTFPIVLKVDFTMGSGFISVSSIISAELINTFALEAGMTSSFTNNFILNITYISVGDPTITYSLKELGAGGGGSSSGGTSEFLSEVYATGTPSQSGTINVNITLDKDLVVGKKYLVQYNFVFDGTIDSAGAVYENTLNCILSIDSGTAFSSNGVICSKLCFNISTLNTDGMRNMLIMNAKLISDGSDFALGTNYTSIQNVKVYELSGSFGSSGSSSEGSGLELVYSTEVTVASGDDIELNGLTIEDLKEYDEIEVELSVTLTTEFGTMRGVRRFKQLSKSISDVLESSVDLPPQLLNYEFCYNGTVSMVLNTTLDNTELGYTLTLNVYEQNHEGIDGTPEFEPGTYKVDIYGKKSTSGSSGGSGSGGSSPGSGSTFIDVTELPENPDSQTIYRVIEPRLYGFDNNGLFDFVSLVEQHLGAVQLIVVDKLPDNPIESTEANGFIVYIVNDTLYLYVILDPEISTTPEWIDFSVFVNIVGGFTYGGLINEFNNLQEGYVYLYYDLKSYTNKVQDKSFNFQQQYKLIGYVDSTITRTSGSLGTDNIRNYIQLNCSECVYIDDPSKFKEFQIRLHYSNLSNEIGIINITQMGYTVVENIIILEGTSIYNRGSVNEGIRDATCIFLFDYAIQEGNISQLIITFLTLDNTSLNIPTVNKIEIYAK